MGQCTSRKAAGAFAASAAVTHQKKPSAMHKHKKLQESPSDESDNKKRYSPHSKGVAMSFGFKKRPNNPQVIGNTNAARRLANPDPIDRNGNNGDTDPLTSNAVPSGRTTPRLPAPKKEANATRVSRFGFRHPNANRLNKVADINPKQPTRIECSNNNLEDLKTSINIHHPPEIDTNRNRNLVAPIPTRAIQVTSPIPNKTTQISVPTRAVQLPGPPKYSYPAPIPNPPSSGRFTLQTTHLPKPQVPIIETKAAKTLANNNRKISASMQQPSGDESSSKDGSLTEDSGVGSHTSGHVGDPDILKRVDHLDSSPTYGARKLRQKPRNLGVVLTGNTFDVKDLEDNSEPEVSLPRLPSAFQPSHYTAGFVREGALQCQRQLDRDKRKISVTSSEGCSDDYGEEEKTYRERHRSEKTFVKSPPQKSFLKPRNFKDDYSSDEHDWAHAGEAMADATSCSFSSSDESKSPHPQRPLPLASNLTSVLQNLLTASLNNTIPKHEIKNALLTLEDPKFAAIAASTNTGGLLEDETSPTDSLICSYSENEEVLKKKMNGSSSNSKDINEKLSPSSPGTPTNASNSLSLSEGRDFLIDDEIADQPALMFDDTLTVENSETFSANHTSEVTPTLIVSTPKPKRRVLGTFEGSPLALKNKKFLRSRAGSVDTLSPCESIASDDLMMDFDRSQSSGLEDLERCERNGVGFNSLEHNSMGQESDRKCGDIVRDWTTIFGNGEKAANKCVTRTSRLLRSRAETPCSGSSVPDSPRSLDSRISNPRTRACQSPLRLSRGSYNSPAGYESDDSIRLDRANHGAMVQDVMSMKAMLLKLKRVLHEQAEEEFLLRAETHNPFEVQKNGLFNGLSSDVDSVGGSEENSTKIELSDLRRQVLFLQGQLEDKEKTVQLLQTQVSSLMDHHTSNSAPASTVSTEVSTCNAATQTERIRPISAGPSLLQTSPDGNVGSLVSANERRSRLPSAEKLSPNASPNLAKPPSRLWRKPGEPPSPQRYSSPHTSSIPRRSCSRTRAPTTPS